MLYHFGFIDKEFGEVRIICRRGMKRIIFRWEDDHLCISLPHGLSQVELRQSIERNREQLRALRKQATTTTVKYYEGQQIPLLAGEAVIEVGYPGATKYYYDHIDPTCAHIKVPPGTRFEDKETVRTISSILEKVAQWHAQLHFLDFFNRVEEELGVKARALTIGRGRRKLGHCTSTGEVMISRNAAFLPPHLVRHLICHELAHLTHPNHSAAFHELLNRYDNGNEARLEAELRAFRFPLL